MTVKPVTSDSQDRISCADFQKSKEPPSYPEFSTAAGGEEEFGADRSFSMCDPKTKNVWSGEVETDQESWGSSDETESPKSVAKVGQRWRKKIASVHSQVLRIREEDSHIGEDIGEAGLSAKDNKMIAHHLHHHDQHMNLVIFSRPILPSSPLSGKTAVKALH